MVRTVVNNIQPAVVKAVFTLADPALAPVLVERLGSRLGAVLRTMPDVPEALADAVRASGDALLVGALADGRRRRRDARPGLSVAPARAHPGSGAIERSAEDRGGGADPTAGDLNALLDLDDLDDPNALLDLDDPAVDARLFAGAALDVAERARLLAGIRRDGTRGPVPEALTELLWAADLGRCARWLTAGMASGDPEVARVIVNRLPLRTEAGRLRVVVGVWTRHGSAAARGVLGEADYPADTRASIEDALARPDGLAELRARLAEWELPERVVDLLRGGEPERVDDLLGDGGTLPWPALIDAHRRTALPARLHARLAEVPDCPHELLIALLAEGLAEPDGDDERWWLHEALVRGRLSGADVLRHARPAPVVLSVLAGLDGRTLPERWASGAPRAEAHTLVEEFLGDDAAAWIVALGLFPDFTGTIPELLATARAMVADGGVGSTRE
ncbi:hypothetical protein [Embleya sp. AB8]|uniref:hypothetical protein n=1 Tax=Embleya sp. AB8 TaxID=3156304 RepID=UPI003C724588